MLILIPARTGSVRVPNKNFRPLTPDGRCCTDLAVDLAQGYGPVVVSTDHPTYERDGAIVMARPAVLATATALVRDEALRVLRAFPEERWLMLLQPSSPLRRKAHLLRALQWQRRDPTATAIVSVTLDGDTYVRDGTVYLVARETLEAGDWYGRRTRYIPIPGAESLNIDTDADWLRAEEWYGTRRRHSGSTHRCDGGDQFAIH